MRSSFLRSFFELTFNLVSRTVIIKSNNHVLLVVKLQHAPSHKNFSLTQHTKIDAHIDKKLIFLINREIIKLYSHTLYPLVMFITNHNQIHSSTKSRGH